MSDRDGQGKDEDVAALVDAGRLLAFLRSNDPTIGTEPLEVKLLSGGRSNLTFLVTAGERKLILRRAPLGISTPGAHDMRREYRVLSALQGQGLPTPPVVGVSGDPAVVGAEFYVMEHVPGLVVERRSDVADRSHAWARSSSIAVIEGLVGLHAVDTDAVGLGDFGWPEGFLRRRLSRWVDQWFGGDHRDLPRFAAVADALRDSLPAGGETTLIHGDYRLGNVILGDDGALAAILDWEMSTRGDPLTDLAHLIVYWAPTCGRITHESQEISAHGGFLSADELAEEYAERSGRDLRELSFYLAFEHWRAAVIKEGIYHRYLRGQTRGPGFETIGASVPLHLEEAWDILNGSSACSNVAS